MCWARWTAPTASGSSNALRGDGEPAVRVERLRQAINRLLDDGTPFEHPPGLAQRTVAFVARNRRRSRSLPDYVPVRVPFRWADFAVAASIFIAGVLTLLPAIQRSRERMNQAGCLFNLQQLGNSFGQYASLQPVHAVSAVRRGPMPRRGRSRRSCTTRACSTTPSSWIAPATAPARTRARGARGLRPDRAHPRKTIRRDTSTCSRWDYAYNVGYRHASGAPGAARVRAFLADPRDGRPAQPRELPHDQGRQQSESRGPGAERPLRRRQRPDGSAPATSAPTTPTSSSTTITSPAGRPCAGTRCWCRAKTPFRGW